MKRGASAANQGVSPSKKKAKTISQADLPLHQESIDAQENIDASNPISMLNPHPYVFLKILDDALKGDGAVSASTLAAVSHRFRNASGMLLMTHKGLYRNDQINKAHAAQQEKIEYLISKKEKILWETGNNSAVKKCFDKLLKASPRHHNSENTYYFPTFSNYFPTLTKWFNQFFKAKQHFKMDDSRAFMVREQIINELNAAIIRARIKPNETELYCRDCHLTCFPASVLNDPTLQEYWTKLQHLDLSQNQLTELPAAIGQLAALKWFNLRYNQLTGLPAAIGQLAALKCFYLDHNQLTELPAAILRLAALEWFDLGENQLTELPAAIGQLAALEKLFLDNNQLINVPPNLAKIIHGWLIRGIRMLDSRTRLFTLEELMATQRPQQPAAAFIQALAEQNEEQGQDPIYKRKRDDDENSEEEHIEEELSEEDRHEHEQRPKAKRKRI